MTTIAAIATPPGEGAIGIVRISGPEALEIAGNVFSGDVQTYASHTAHLGRIVSKNGSTIDEVLLLVMLVIEMVSPHNQRRKWK